MLIQLIRDEIIEPVIIQEKVAKKNSEIAIRKYSRGKVLGKGGFATCYEVTEIEKNHTYAAKVISKASLTKKRALEKVLNHFLFNKTYFSF